MISRRPGARFNRGRIYTGGLPLIQFDRNVTGATVLQSVQTDLGMTYGATLLASGTTPPVITFTGTLSGKVVPIWVKCTPTPGALGAWTGAVYYDGTGTTAEQTFLSAATVALTGKGAGLTLNIAAGNAATDNVWKATSSAWADQSAGAKNYSQGTAAKQPILSTGLNSFPGLILDGVDDSLASALNLPAPGTTPTWMCAIVRQVGWVNNGRIWGATSNANVQLLYQAVGSPRVLGYNGTNSSNIDTMTVGSWFRVEEYWSNSTNDYVQVGGTAATGVNLANNTATGREIGSAANSLFSNIEILELMYCNALPNERCTARGGNGALDALFLSKYGSAVGF